MSDISISGKDNIAHVMELGMHSTLQSLVHDGLLTDEQADEFIKDKVCVVIDDHTVWKRIRKFIGFSDEESKDHIRCVLMRVC